MSSDTERPAATTAPAAPRVLEVYSPVTGKRERTVVPTPLDEVEQIVGRAREAQQAWAARPLAERSKHLLAVVDTLAGAAEDVAERIHHFNGKTREEAIVAEVFPTMATFRFFAKKAHKHLRPQTVHLDSLPIAYSKMLLEPLGVIGVISPWNYPLKLMLQDVPAALMAGNAVVIKVSEHSTAIGELTDDLLRRAGMPPGLVQLIYGYGDLGAKLTASGIDKVCFTGSTATGRKVYEAAARAMIPCSLELGGKDAAIVLDDADLDDAARGILWGALTNSGQTCASIELAYVPERHKDTFLDKLALLARKLPPGSVGSMNVLFQKEKVSTQVAQARELGARVVAESEQGDARNPFCMNPLVLTDVPRNADLFREETFGPVIPVIGYDDLEQVVDEVNASPYGLTSSIWTRNRRRGEQLAHRLDSGVVTINEHLITPGMPEAPWGGHKMSGLGVSMSRLSLQSFSKIKYVYHDRGLVRFKFWRYPFTAEKTAWFRGFLKAEFAPSALTRAGYLLRSLPKLLLRRNPRFEKDPG